MTRMTREGRRSYKFSVFVKCVLLLTITTAIVAGVISITSDRTMRNVATEGLLRLANEASGFQAENLRGAVRFRKTEDIQAIIEDFADRKGADILGIIVTAADGAVLATTGQLPGTDLAQLETLAEVATATAQPEATADGFWLAQPIGASETPIGAIAIAWSAETKLAKLNEDRTRQLMLAAGVFAVLTFASGLFFRQSLAVPMTRLSQRTELMAEGDLKSEIPHQARADEIGQIADQLELLREKLHDAEKATRDAVFQSAGFQGASVALVMTDIDFRITHQNSAFARILDASKELQNCITTDQVLAPRQLEGAFSGSLPKTADVAIGENTYAVSLNKIVDASGNGAGYVMEWNDVTQTRVTEAVLTALEKTQIRVDFDANKTLTHLNGVARTLAPHLRKEVGSSSMGDIIRFADGSDLDARTNDDTTEFDTFTFANDRLVSGVLSPIVGSTGNATGYVFLGHDITESEHARKAAERQRETIEEEQSLVVSALSSGLMALADGDLTIRFDEAFPERHETLRAHFNSSMESMENAVARVRDNSTSILNEAGNISSAADDLSRRTEQQAATLEEFAASLTELTAAVSATAEGAGQASDVVTTARDNAEASGSVVREAVDAMSEIAGSSERISRIISVIDDIAFQTNLLALNAGVEAARAGDAGRGFAVVASEVRALAQRSSEAASEINELISSSSTQVKRGVSLVGRAGEALESIVGSIGGIADHVNSIAASAREQSTGIDEINTAMSQLDQATQQNVAMFEETTAATHTLRAEASALVAASNRFRVDGSARTGPLQSTHAAPTLGSSSRPEPIELSPASRQKGQVSGALALSRDEDDDWEDF